MGKLTKNQKLAAEKIEAGKAYSLKEAASLVKENLFPSKLGNFLTVRLSRTTLYLSYFKQLNSNGRSLVNIMEFCKQFNARTQDKAGKILPVIITYYADKSFINIKRRTTTA